MLYKSKLDSSKLTMTAYSFFAPAPEYTHFAHILDFDVLRLGKKVIENNPKAGSFEFGVVVITEVGKERANNLELKELKIKLLWIRIEVSDLAVANRIIQRRSTKWKT